MYSLSHYSCFCNIFFTNSFEQQKTEGYKSTYISYRYGTASDFQRYKEDYIKLYVDTIKAVAEETDDSHPFVISSPNNGIESEEEGHVAENPYDTLYGDG